MKQSLFPLAIILEFVAIWCLFDGIGAILMFTLLALIGYAGFLYSLICRSMDVDAGKPQSQGDHR